MQGSHVAMLTISYSLSIRENGLAPVSMGVDCLTLDVVGLVDVFRMFGPDPATRKTIVAAFACRRQSPHSAAYLPLSTASRWDKRGTTDGNIPDLKMMTTSGGEWSRCIIDS
jgi:hypothetical protein